MEKNTSKKPDTYAKAGVDFRKESRAVKGIQGWVSKTFDARKGKIGQVLNEIGSFANLIDMGDFALSFCIDGVGSKILVAQELDKYDTIGIDCVAMNVNDTICVGAEPISMVDYLAMERTYDEQAKEISKGLYEGAMKASISIVGGETASLPEIVTGIGGKGFDIAAAVIGVVKKDKIIDCTKIKPGDAIIGFKSSGIHSNGLTLARKVLPKNMWMNMLTPTRIYVNEVMQLHGEYDIHGMANITGGGFLNVLRLTKYGFVLDGLPEPQMIFKKIQELGKISDEEMYKTFNMGIGYCMIVSNTDADSILKKYAKKYELMRIGEVVEDPGVKIVRNEIEIVLNSVMY